MIKPTPELYRAAERVLIYLISTKELGLNYDSGATAVASGLSDSDWAAKHSTTGWLFSLGSAVVSWRSAKQGSVALSSTEAEVVAASYAACEAVYLRALLLDLGFEQTEATELGVDNQGAVHIAKNAGASHTRMKHVARRHFFVRELVADGTITVKFVPTDANVADLFTKPLSAKRFVELRNAAMNISD